MQFRPFFADFNSNSKGIQVVEQYRVGGSAMREPNIGAESPAPVPRTCPWSGPKLPDMGLWKTREHTV